MKFISKQIERSRIPELAGFKAEKVDVAVRQYLDMYEKNSKLPEFFDYGVHEIETVVHMGSTEDFVELKRTNLPISSKQSPFKNGIVLGLSLPESEKSRIDLDEFGTGCGDLGNKDVKRVLDVMDRLNNQLKAEGMPHLAFIPEFSPSSNMKDPVIHIRSCDNLPDKAIGNYDDNLTKPPEDEKPRHLEARIRMGDARHFKGTLVHEISHMFAQHPQDVVDLSKVDPEVLNYLCSHSDRAGTRGSSLIYQTSCIKHNKSFPYVPVQKFGRMEMLTLKKFYGASDAERLQDVNNAIGEVVKDIRVQYGTRIASQAIAAFFAALVFTTMIRGCPPTSRSMYLSISSFSQMVGWAVMISQLPDQAAFAVNAGAVLMVSSKISKTSHAFTKMLTSAGLSMAFLSLYRGQSGLVIGLAGAYGGSLCGRLCGEIYNTLRCMSLNRQAGYMSAHTSGAAFVDNRMMERVQSRLDRNRDNILSRVCRTAPEPLRKVMGKIAELDQCLAHVVEEYPTFNFAYRKLLTELPAQTDEHSISEASFHSTDEQYFFDAEQGIGFDQAVELEMGGVTANDQLASLEVIDEFITELYQNRSDVNSPGH